MELDAGISVVFFKIVGVTAGYHYDVSHIERDDESDAKRAEWTVQGPYAGVLVQF
jgi:hypothetical protein